MLPEGRARLFLFPRVPARKDPTQCTTKRWNAPSSIRSSGQQSNPVVRIWKSELDKYAEICDPKYPYIATTFRVTEHWQAGL